MFREADARALRAAFGEVIAAIDLATLRRDDFSEDALVPEGAAPIAFSALIDTGYSPDQIDAIKDRISKAAISAGRGNISAATQAKLVTLLNYIPTLMGEA